MWVIHLLCQLKSLGNREQEFVLQSIQFHEEVIFVYLQKTLPMKAIKKSMKSPEMEDKMYKAGGKVSSKMKAYMCGGKSRKK